MPKPRSAVDIVSGGPGSADVRRIPVVVAPPAAAFEDAAGVVDEFKAFARIRVQNIDVVLKTHLAAAVSQFESMTWRAFLRQTREQLLPPRTADGDGYGGGPSDGYGFGYYGGDGRDRDRGAVYLDEPFEAGTVRVYAVDRDGDVEASVVREMPEHGRLWTDWPATYAALAVRVRYDAGWEDAASVPADMKGAVFRIAHAEYDANPDRAADSKMLIMQRYNRRRRPAAVAFGTMDSGGGGLLVKLVSAVASQSGSATRVGHIIFVPPRSPAPGRPEQNYAGYTFTTAATWIKIDPDDEDTAPSLVAYAAATALSLDHGTDIISLEDEYDGLGGHTVEGEIRKDCVFVDEVQGQTAPEFGGIGTDRDARVNLRFSLRMDGGGRNRWSRERLKLVRDWLIAADDMDLGTRIP